MKIEKAIEILTRRFRLGDPLKNPLYEDALKLGIEALKQLQELRSWGLYSAAPRLPGETEE